jgi:hypothetical protein
MHFLYCFSLIFLLLFELVTLSTGLAANDNADRVARAQQHEREKAKTLHAQEVQRNKEALQKQLKAKEEKKERTAKKERRRGMM